MDNLTIDEVMKRVMERNVHFEHQCIEQAKRELGNSPTSGIAYIRDVMKRAQQIKAERKANGEQSS